MKFAQCPKICLRLMIHRKNSKSVLVGAKLYWLGVSGCRGRGHRRLRWETYARSNSLPGYCLLFRDIGIFHGLTRSLRIYFRAPKQLLQTKACEELELFCTSLVMSAPEMLSLIAIAKLEACCHEGYNSRAGCFSFRRFLMMSVLAASAEQLGVQKIFMKVKIEVSAEEQDEASVVDEGLDEVLRVVASNPKSSQQMLDAVSASKSRSVRLETPETRTLLLKLWIS